jgi:hypothetical protein
MSSLSIPYRFASGNGNPPAGERFAADNDWLTALLLGDFMANGGQENWNGGTSFTNPATGTLVSDYWTLRKSGTSGATANITQEAATIDAGTYSAKVAISVAGSADSILAFDQLIKEASLLKGETIVLGFKVYASTASKVRVKINDGVNTPTYSSYHTGSGAWELLQAVVAIASTATSITVSVEMVSDFTGNVFIDSGYVYDVPSQMAQTARQALAWSRLVGRIQDTDLVFAFGKGPIVTDQDGSGRLWRLGVSNGDIGADPI